MSEKSFSILLMVSTCSHHMAKHMSRAQGSEPLTPPAPQPPRLLPAGAEELSDAEAAALSYSKAQIITNLRIGVM